MTKEAGARSKLTDYQRGLVVFLWESGASAVAISTIIDCSLPTIRNVVQQFSADPKRPSINWRNSKSANLQALIKEYRERNNPWRKTIEAKK